MKEFKRGVGGGRIAKNVKDGEFRRGEGLVGGLCSGYQGEG